MSRTCCDARNEIQVDDGTAEWHDEPSSGSSRPSESAMTPRSTVVYVAYATRSVDLRWLPAEAPVVIVHNDDTFDRASTGHRPVLHLGDGTNVGFGGAINRALDHVHTERVVLCNPDVALTSAHFSALAEADVDDVATIPLVDANGSPTSVVNAYPSPLSHLASGFRLGRFAPRGGTLRKLGTPVFGDFGRAHRDSLDTLTGSWALCERWVSGALMSVATERLREVGGFDPRFFMYYEDVDLCARLAARRPEMKAAVLDVAPGIHHVGGSSTSTDDARRVARIRRDSAVLYADTRSGTPWRLAARALSIGAGS